MIQPGDTEFPNNIIKLVAARIPSYVDPLSDPDDRIKVLLRELRVGDPEQAVGVFPAFKRPSIDSMEMASKEPTLNRYSVILQTYVVNAIEEDCVSVHSIITNRLWKMLYRDSILNGGLTMLEVVNDNSTERLQRRGVELQRFLSNEVDGKFIQTSWTECWFETETV